eukprot:TRINITY_DN17268_c0_g1_i9.p1 TRINITY_DN17268_c0_g1~~TRINITY_DN17268_c0_g1_i9.p1  ORF type:complete len:164 (+),score=36.81 TRINITY_DN17268_c0_g1_i9:73-564(+)
MCIRDRYIAATYFYMFIIGYQVKDISIVCATREQKDLVKEIIEEKGLKLGLVSELPMIRTASRFQGLTSKILLVSMVRSKSMGIFKDTRRFKHLAAQAKDGLYIFGAKKTYEKLWTEEPAELVLVPGERHSTTRTTDVMPEGARTVKNYKEMYELLNSIIAQA